MASDPGYGGGRMKAEQTEPVTPQEEGPEPLRWFEIWKMVQMQRHVIAAFVGVIMVVALIGNLLAEKKYRANAVIQISSRAGQELRVDEVVDYDRLSQERTYIKTQIDLLRSRDVREEVIRRYEALGFTDLTVDDGGADKLYQMLKVAARRDTELVDVSVTDSDSERAARLANLVTEVYRARNLDARRDSASEAKTWLQEQLIDYKQRIVDESEELIVYQASHDLADAEEDITRLSATMDALNTAYAAVNTERVLLETTVRGHEALFATKAYDALAKDMNTPLVIELTEEYSVAATENASIAARYLERMPERRYSEARLAGIELELRKEVARTLATEQAQLGILRDKERSLLAEIDSAKALLLARQGLHEEYERLKLKLERSKQFYATLSQRDGELDLASRTTLSNVRVIDEARPDPRVVSPTVARNMAIALMASLLLGIVIGFLIEYLDDTITSPFHVSTYLRVPFLGIVPRLMEAGDDRRRALYTHEHPNSPAAEAVRAIRTLLELSPAAKSLKRLMITSSNSGEGKTNTAVSLAVSFATLGRRVLVVDADIRRPRQHHIFDVPRETGLSTILKGGPITGAIVPTGIPRIDILPSGPRTEGTNELLASVAMSHLLDELDSRYDLILVDTPPAGILSDAAILSKLVDGVVFVVREKTVSRWHARDVVYRLQQVGAPLLGVVLNNFDMTSRNAKYKYYYDYRYQYREETKAGAEAS